MLTLKRGYDLPEHLRNSGTVPVVSSSGITGLHSQAKVKGPGVVTGRYGTLGQVFYIDHDFWPLNTSLYVVDFKGNHPRFAAYLLQTLQFGQQNVAGAVPGVNRNYLHRIDVTVPPLLAQRKIASILSAYDDLIENNLRRIRILEEMAQSLYKQWFVDFRFPRHEGVKMVDSPLGLIPEGWEVKGLFSVASVTYGKPFKSGLFNSAGEGKPVIRIRDIPTLRSNTFTTEEADPRYAVDNGDLLIGMDGDFHMGMWAGGSALVNQRVVLMRPKKPVSTAFLSLALGQPIADLNSAITGTTVAHLLDGHLRGISLAIPPDSLTHELCDPLDNLAAQTLKLRLANQALRETRDLLLPKLVSGEIDVTDLDIDVGEDAA